MAKHMCRFCTSMKLCEEIRRAECAENPGTQEQNKIKQNKKNTEGDSLIQLDCLQPVENFIFLQLRSSKCYVHPAEHLRRTATRGGTSESEPDVKKKVFCRQKRRNKWQRDKSCTTEEGLFSLPLSVRRGDRQRTRGTVGAAHQSCRV